MENWQKEPHEQSSNSEEETVERIIEALERGESIQLNIGSDVDPEAARRVIETLRQEGFDVIVPSDN